VHALRAVDYLEKLHVGNADDFATTVNMNRNRMDAYDPRKKYEPKEVWHAEHVGEDIVLTATMCGIRLRVHGNWEPDRLDFNTGSCVANFCSGPYKATTTDLRPCILLLIQQPKEDESLGDYAKKFLSDGRFEPDPALLCPTSHCIAMKGVQPRMYKKNGDGHGRVVVFEREQPEFPGLIFESPVELPKSNASSGVTYYRPTRTQERIPGKLYYLVLLDSASSIEEPALKDYEFFLQNLVVE